METKTLLANYLLRFFASLIFATGTMAFVLVPYALCAHPGEAATQLAATAPRHLS